MKVIAKKRGYEKTTELIKMSAATGDYIVTKDHRTAYYTTKLAKDLGYEIPFPLTYDEFLNERFAAGNRISGFLIDDADQLLFSLIPMGIPVHAVVFNTESTSNE